MGSLWSRRDLQRVSTTDDGDEERLTTKDVALEDMPTASSMDRPRGCCCSMRACLILCGISWALFVVIELVALVEIWTTEQDVISAVRSLPTRKDWTAYTTCLVNPEACNLCTSPATLFMQPTDVNRVALVSMRGTGGTWLRLLLEAGTRSLWNKRPLFATNAKSPNGH